MAKEKPEGPNPIDKHVGARIRERRKDLGMSQERLAEHLGLTFQQVQKYERGANRVSASKLYEVARGLHVSIAYFFEHLAAPEDAVPGMAEAEPPEFRHDFIMTPEGMELAKAFPKIKSRKMRRQILDLVRVMAEQDEDEEA